MKIKKGDSVVIITGDERGQAPHKQPTPRKVISVLDGGKKLVIEGVNRTFKHVRRGHPKSPQGGRLQIELPIDASNVKLFCPSCGSPTRVGHRFTDEGVKERFCKKCDAALGEIGRAKSSYAKK